MNHWSVTHWSDYTLRSVSWDGSIGREPYWLPTDPGWDQVATGGHRPGSTTIAEGRLIIHQRRPVGSDRGGCLADDCQLCTQRPNQAHVYPNRLSILRLKEKRSWEGTLWRGLLWDAHFRPLDISVCETPRQRHPNTASAIIVSFPSANTRYMFSQCRLGRALQTRQMWTVLKPRPNEHSHWTVPRMKSNNFLSYGKPSGQDRNSNTECWSIYDAHS